MTPIATSGFWPELRWGELQLSPYFLIISLVMSGIAWRLPYWAQAAGLSPRRSLDLFIATSLGGFLGARLLHVVWEEPSYYAESLIRVFELWRGGFVWWGGLMGGALTGFILLRRWREAIGPWLDFFAPILALGYAGGRVACWAVGCCHGWVCEWGTQAWVLPSQGFAVIWELGLWFLLSRQKANRFFIWMIGHGLGRVLMELMRGDDRGPSLPLWSSSSTPENAMLNLTISMGLSLLMMLIGTHLLVRRLVTLGPKMSPSRR
jgi:phosphatidylglycerol:prolipoprotein diacylglycerol transferase